MFLSIHIINVFKMFSKIHFQNDINSLEFFANLRFLIEPIIGLSEHANQRQRELIHYIKMSQRDRHTAIVTLYAYQTVGQRELAFISTQ